MLFLKNGSEIEETILSPSTLQNRSTDKCAVAPSGGIFHLDSVMQ
jgi:hypothetical protein